MKIHRSIAVAGCILFFSVTGCDKKKAENLPPVTPGAPTGLRGTQPTVAGSEQSARNSASGAATRPEH